MSPASGLVTPGISSDLDGYESDYWPVHMSDMGLSRGIGPQAPEFPVTSFAQQLSGWKTHSYSDDFYHRIHINPVVLDLGNLVSEQERRVTVWNAFLTPQTLIDTPMEGGEGIEITAPGTLPLVFRPLQEREWILQISTDGPAIVGAVWTFQFSGLDAQVVTITGDRIVPWSFAPDWTDGILERLSWRTDVMSSPTRAEQRRALRLSPTRSFEVRSLLEGSERSNFDLAVYSWGGRTWAMPVWPDIVWLPTAVPLGSTAIACDTAGRDFAAGGLALLRASGVEETRRYEVVEVDTVGPAGLSLARPSLAAWPRGSRLYPLRLAELTQQPQVRRMTDTTVEARYRFEVVEPTDWPAVMPATTYRGWPVLEQAPEESEELSVEWERSQLVLENPTGFGRRTDTAATPATLQQHRWLLGGREAQGAYRSLLYALQGRLKSMWVPTFSSDLVATAVIGAASTTIDIANVDYARFGAKRVGRRDIRIELHDGTAFHRRIDAAAVVDFDTERLAVDVPLGVEVTPGRIRRISFLALCRLNVDTVEIQHSTDADGTAKSAATFRSIRDDV